MTRQARRYTAEFKQEAVNLSFKLPSVSKAAEELGIPLATLHTWIKQLKGTPDITTSNGTEKKQDIAALIEENRRLHKELAIAKEEKEILKKAAAYFAQHQK